MTTPEHVFVAASTGVSDALFEKVSLDKDKLIFHDGEVWIPLETTLLGSSVQKAWDEAAKEVGKQRKAGKVEVIEIRTAWHEFPPSSLGVTGEAQAFDDAKLAASVREQFAKLEGTRTAAIEKAMAKADAALATKETGEALNEKGRMLVLVGQHEEALALFKKAATHKTARAQAHNNAGNVLAVASRLKEAMEAYEAAMKAGDDGRVQVNAAMVAFLLGDEDHFMELLIGALESGAETEVARLSRMGVAPGGTRSADASRRADRDLGDAVRAALEKKKMTVKGLAPKSSGTRARDASEGSSTIEGALYWL